MDYKSLKHLIWNAVIVLNESPRLHPNGFIQLNLNKEGTKRLHIWSPDIPLSLAQKTRHPIHDHIFDMESTVLVGELHNYTFDFFDSKERKEHALFQATYVRPHDSVLQPNGRVGYLVKKLSDKVTAGNTYTLPAYIFHDSCPVGFTATLMEKKQVYNWQTCTVVIPCGVDPDNDFKRDAAISQSKLFKEIKKLLTNKEFRGIMSNTMNLKETTNV